MEKVNFEKVVVIVTGEIYSLDNGTKIINFRIPDISRSVCEPWKDQDTQCGKWEIEVTVVKQVNYCYGVPKISYVLLRMLKSEEENQNEIEAEKRSFLNFLSDDEIKALIRKEAPEFHDHTIDMIMCQFFTDLKDIRCEDSFLVKNKEMPMLEKIKVAVNKVRDVIKIPVSDSDDYSDNMYRPNPWYPLDIPKQFYAIPGMTQENVEAYLSFKVASGYNPSCRKDYGDENPLGGCGFGALSAEGL